MDENTSLINIGDAFLHLEAIGLVKFFPSNSVIVGKLTHEITVYYYGRELQLFPKNCELPIGTVTLTKIGNELAPICDGRRVDGFFEYVKGYWERMGYVDPFRKEPK